jgi:hypothetical protein
MTLRQTVRWFTLPAAALSTALRGATLLGVGLLGVGLLVPGPAGAVETVVAVTLAADTSYEPGRFAYVAAPPSDGFIPVLPDAPLLDPPAGDESGEGSGDESGDEGGEGSDAAADAEPVWDDPGPQIPARPLPAGGIPEPPPRVALIDRVHVGVYRGVDATGRWVDGWFDRDDPSPPEEPTLGRLGAGLFYDQRDGLDPSFRLRARIPFTKARNRLGLLLGRGPERELIENRPRAGTNSLPNGFQNVDDEAWLLGLGYNPNGQIGQGFSFDAGVRLRLDPELFARAAYRWNIELSERTLFRPTQTVFWLRTRGFGETTDLTLDHLIGKRFMLRTAVAGTVAEDTTGLQWQSYVTLFQDLKGRDTLAWSALASGETEAEVPVRSYGLQLRYRRRVLRDWLFVELLNSVTWPKVLTEERREANFGVGLGFEMYFGPVPDAQLR